MLDDIRRSQAPRNRMTRDQIIQKLQTIMAKGRSALRLLEATPRTPTAQAEIQSLAKWIKDELASEFKRMSPEPVQKTLTMFELSVYCPTEEAWTDTGLSRLRVDGPPNEKWSEVLEAVVYKAGKYLH